MSGALLKAINKVIAENHKASLPQMVRHDRFYFHLEVQSSETDLGHRSSRTSTERGGKIQESPAQGFEKEYQGNEF